MFKKVKIRAYLAKKENSKSPFDLLLSDYLDGRLKMELNNIGLQKISIYVDFTEDVKCIGVQAKYQAYRIDMQIYPDEFSFAYDSDEPDNFSSYPLNGREQVYTIVQSIIKMIHLKFS
jgi:hypothetical protein